MVQAMVERFHDEAGEPFLCSVEDVAEYPDVPWMGIVHGAVQTPSERCLEQHLKLYRWRKGEKTCRKLFTLCKHSAEWLSPLVPFPVDHLPFCATPATRQFDWDEFERNNLKRLVVVGGWLRNFAEADRTHSKFLQVTMLGHPSSVHPVIPRQSKEGYDELLSKNVAYLPLDDAAACTGLMDCISRDTPVIVRRLPAVVEYVGADYPLLYETVAEAVELSNSPDLIHAGHEHIRAIDKSRFSVETFIQELSRKAS